MIPARRSLGRQVRTWLGSGVSLALVGLFAGGCAGGSSQASRPQDGSGSITSPKVWRPAVPDTAGPIVAVVGSRKITRHEIDSLILTAPPSIQAELHEFEGYRSLVDRVVTQEAVVSAAELSGIPDDPAFQAELARNRSELLVRRYYERKVRELPAIPDSAVKAYYDSHPEEFTLSARARIRHIELATQKKARQVRASLEKGALWDQTCLKQSLDGATKDNGGFLGYVTPGGDLVPGVGKSPAIVAAAFSLPVGDVSQPLKGPKSWHLILVDNREEQTVRPFPESAPTIRRTLEAKQREAYGQVFADSVKIAANAVIFDDSIRVALRPPKTAADLFKEAQSAATPLLRIQLYRDLVRDFPTDSIAVQAEFMVGFTYAEELNDYDAARTEFEQFIQKYPTSELSESARWMLDNMDKPAPPLEGEPEEGDAPGGTDSLPPGSGTHGAGGVPPDGAPR